jgi:RND superfamily putative drug exporter
MSEKLAGLSQQIVKHWKRYLLVVIAAIVGLSLLAVTASPAPTDNFNIPGSESQTALELFEKYQPALAGVDSSIVFNVQQGKLTDPDNAKQIQEIIKNVKQLDHVISAPDPLSSSPPMISKDGKIALSSVVYDLTATEVSKQDGLDLQNALDSTSGNVETSMTGQVADAAYQESFPVGELLGIFMAIILLSILFRSKTAMFTTLSAALIGVLIGQLLLTILASPLGLPDFAKTIAVMLGLGAGIDYSLLVLSRYREQVNNGDSPSQAIAQASATSGVSVVAAGIIVVAAVSGLLVIGIPLIGKMGIGAAIGVATVVASVLTILPIIVGGLNKRLKPKNIKDTQPSPRFQKWGQLVTSKPWLAIGVGVSLLLILAFPLLNMQLGQPDDGNQPKGETQRTAYDLISKGFGAGYNGPFLLAVEMDLSAGKEKLKQDLTVLYKDLSASKDVASVAPPSIAGKGKLAIITLIPASSPQDKRTSQLLDNLRNNVIPKATNNSALQVYVGGTTAGIEDFSAKVSERLPVFILIVIGFSVLLLMAVFRSLWVPLFSALFNLLSVAAAYGIIVAVFQKGYGASLLGVEAGVPIVSFIPVMIFAILFGLSMDYNVFLISRIHEAFKGGEDARESVVIGVSKIGKIILFAGLIMASVFLAFVTQNSVPVKMIGVGLGAAILVDVLLIRLLIAPAVIYILGDKAWHMPKWLDKIMPNISMEGHLVKTDSTDQNNQSLNKESSEKS